MKKFTLTIVAALIAVVAFGQKARTMVPFENSKVLEVLNKEKLSMQKLSKKQDNAKRRAITAQNLVGKYTWNYAESETRDIDPTKVESQEGSGRVTINPGSDDYVVSIAGLFPLDVLATIDKEHENLIMIDPEQDCYVHSTYGACEPWGVFYYQGDDEHEAGWYLTEIYGFVNEQGVIQLDTDTWIIMRIKEGEYKGYVLGTFILPGSTLTPMAEQHVVEVPASLQTNEYFIVSKDNEGNEQSSVIKVGFDGNDVYFQGFDTSFLPEAWVKGTMFGQSVTIPGGQYMGTYADRYDVYFMQPEGDVGLNYDADTKTFTAEGAFYTLVDVNGTLYYGSYYDGAVATQTVEAAATPATPTNLEIEDSEYGPILNFNLPVVDTNGKGMVTSKLSWQLLSDVNGTVSPVTLKPAEYVRLSAEMTEIPYGFTDNYDIYSNYMYLNMDYSTWTKVGIQTIYRGGGEEHKSEIAWYAVTSSGIDTKTVAKRISSETYTDLMGRQVGSNAKGLLIRTVTYADGTKQSMKVVKK